MNVEKIDDIGVFVVHANRALSPPEAERIKSEIKAEVPGAKVIVMAEGFFVRSLSDMNGVERLERKMDMLLSALAEDEPEPESGPTLDGESLGGPRDQTQAL